ncbi:MAG: hypothetical protein EZS28_037050 [Streblomastix strix]|uniref:Uncharacterized protein n=1 Tax=Streblomastix strix TaxID=222440 RepID=A0A5J4UB84_9EUKA|nr:MAG: hypothetical protein EZS28_037050 [Streblomastix strix]
MRNSNLNLDFGRAISLWSPTIELVKTRQHLRDTGETRNIHCGFPNCEAILGSEIAYKFHQLMHYSHLCPKCPFCLKLYIQVFSHLTGNELGCKSRSMMEDVMHVKNTNGKKKERNKKVMEKDDEKQRSDDQDSDDVNDDENDNEERTASTN